MALMFARPTAERKPTLNHALDRTADRTYQYLKKYLGGNDARTVWMAGQRILDLNERTLFYQQVVLEVERRLAKGTPAESAINEYQKFKWQPVGVREFINSPAYLNKANEIYPTVLDAAEQLNNGQYVEAVLTGGIGSGKTTLALYTTAYQLYLLSCMRSPHRVYGLDPSHEILIIFQSITKQLAKGVDYQRFRSMIEESPYFRKNFAFDKYLESELVFPNRIIVRPVSGSDTAAIGQNVIGGIIDELNYMAVVEKSKVSVDKGTYDQAVNVYNSIARRRKSRFLEAGKMPGILCLVSSKRYPGQFTDGKMEEAKRDNTIFVYDKRVWEIKPESFTQGWFNVFEGDMTRKPRVLGEHEELPAADRHLVRAIPEEFREDFQNDIINALREIAGVSTLARHPFFLETEKVNKAFKASQPSIFSQSPVDFVVTRLTLRKGAFFQPELPRFVHVDLAITGDSAGVVVGCVTGFKNIASALEPAYMPKIHIDGVLEVRPPKNSEILFSKIREVLFALRKMGLNIRWVTFDQFQSTDSKQILRQKGFVTGHQSIDDVPCHPYDYTKAAMYEDRLSIPAHPHLQKEILALEKDVKNGKVDHPPNGSKDCADALAGVVYGLTMRREIWAYYKIPLVMIPSSITTARDKLIEKSQPEYQETYGETDELPMISVQ
jgi:hypothetical protein